MTFDPSVISYDDIIRNYFSQNSASSPSWGSQYRSAIMVHNEYQREIVDRVINERQLATGRKVYVDVEYASDFYRAEEYHQKWMDKNASSGNNKWI